MLFDNKFKLYSSHTVAYIVVIKNNDVEILTDLHVFNHLNPKRSLQNVVHMCLPVSMYVCAPR
jgi:hypothetical protein